MYKPGEHVHAVTKRHETFDGVVISDDSVTLTIRTTDGSRKQFVADWPLLWSAMMYVDTKEEWDLRCQIEHERSSDDEPDDD